MTNIMFVSPHVLTEPPLVVNSGDSSDVDPKVFESETLIVLKRPDFTQLWTSGRFARNYDRRDENDARLGTNMISIGMRNEVLPLCARFGWVWLLAICRMEIVKGISSKIAVVVHA